MDVYMVTLYTTGERWMSFVAKSMDAAKRALHTEHGMEEITTGAWAKGSDTLHLQSLKDKSQTATVRRTILVE